MKRIRLFIISILAVSVGLIIGYLGYALPPDNPWDGLSCEEKFEFAMSPEHQDLTMEQHMDFHKGYDLCIQNP